MESIINQQIKILIDELYNGNISEFARKIDEQSQTISKYYNNKSIPGGDIIEKIFTIYKNLSPDWFFRNEGEMFRKRVFIEQLIESIDNRLKKIEGDFYDDEDFQPLPPDKEPPAMTEDLSKKKTQSK